jgi:trehalose 6-phosphate synthase
MVRIAPGGLVTALIPVLERSRGTWVGWCGVAGSRALDTVREASGQFSFRLEPVALERSLVVRYYRGFANGTLWPVFHDLLERAGFRPEEWDAYRVANRRFAEAVAAATTEGDTIWVHDYHLLLVAKEIRRQTLRRLLHFLHIPFPPPDMFARIPWRAELLRGLLAFDLLGFQTRRDAENFLACVRRFAKEARIAPRRGASLRTVEVEGRPVNVGSFPISIDYESFAETARSERVLAKARRIRDRCRAHHILLGADRLDYTKGIPERLLGFWRCLESHPEHRGRTSLIQVTVPSREKVGEYRRQKAEIERLVGMINGEFSTGGWVPVHYLHRRLGREDLVAHYRAADAVLVTPLKDGMNLVVKEYCAGSVEEDGVVVLSEFAGAAEELGKDSLLVNPHDTVQVAEAIHRAVTMPRSEKLRRMRRLRRRVAEHDVHGWATAFLGCATAPVDSKRGPKVSTEA